MKHAIILLASMLVLFGCGNDPSSPTKSNTQYHEFTVQNFTLYAPKQLTRLEVTPSGGGMTQSKDFVCNDQEEQKVDIAIPSMGAYQVKVYSSDGESMWWDSVSLELPGQSFLVVRCSGSPVQFTGECAGLPESGMDMVP